MVYRGGFRTPSRSPRRVRLIPIEVRPYVRTFGAAGLAGEQRLQIGQPDIIGPSVSARRVAALVVGAIDQETTIASGAHFSEGDLGRVGGHRFTKPKAVRAGILAVNNPTTLEASRGVTVV
jgi:hypothetical protein